METQPALPCAVIVTFHPDSGFPERVRRIASQTAGVLIVDNHSDDGSLEIMRALCAGADAKIELIENSENRGIAAALNQGMAWAKANGFEWVLTFDQDSFVSEALAATITAAFADASSASGASVAMVGANYRQTADGQLGYRCAAPQPERTWTPTEYVITSGCLLPLPVYQTVGPFREDFFIDYVDIDYCFRAHALGFTLAATQDCLMEHTVGAMTPHRLLRTWWVSNYAAWRWYYRAHNLAMTARVFSRQEPRWVREAWRSLGVASLKILLFETDKAKKLSNIGHGLWDALVKPLSKQNNGQKTKS